MKSSRERERFWQAHLSAWRRSGLSQREYCRRQEIDEWSLSSWKRRLAKSSPDVVSFVPVTVTSQPALARPGVSKARFQPLTVVVGDQYRVEVGDGFSSETLSRLLAVLGRQ